MQILAQLIAHCEFVAPSRQEESISWKHTLYIPLCKVLSAGSIFCTFHSAKSVISWKHTLYIPLCNKCDQLEAHFVHTTLQKV
jgi:hypothetical protein